LEWFLTWVWFKGRSALALSRVAGQRVFTPSVPWVGLAGVGLAAAVTYYTSGTYTAATHSNAALRKLFDENATGSAKGEKLMNLEDIRRLIGTDPKSISMVSYTPYAIASSPHFCDLYSSKPSAISSLAMAKRS
jgi:hypothetical protein